MGFNIGIVCIFFTGLLLAYLYKGIKIVLIHYKKVGSILFSVLAFVGLIVYLSFKSKLKHSCDGWEIGLFGEAIEESNEINNYCIIHKPKICWLNLLDGVLDLSGNTQCSAQKQSNDDLFKYGYNRTASYIGIPSTKYWTPEERNEQNIQKLLFERLASYDTYEEASQHHDVVMKTNFDNDKKMPEYIIDVKRNETLVEERKKMAKEWEKVHGPPLAKNVIVFYSDAISRRYFKKKLPNIANWFENNRKTFQFFRFHACNGLTYENLWQLNFGCYYNDNPKSERDKHVKTDTEDTRYRSFWKQYKDAGYIIGHSNSICQERMVSLTCQDNKHYIHEPPDHDSQGFACDPNYFQPNNPYGFKQGGNSLFRRCLYGKDYEQNVLDFGEDFLEKYKDERKLLWIETDDAHSCFLFYFSKVDNILFLYLKVSMERTKFLDEPGSKFIKNIQSKGLIDDDTVFMFLSDHGNQMNLLYRFGFQFEQYHTELSLPIVLINIPSSMTESFKNVEKNQQKYFTMHNLYHYFQTIVDPNYEKRDKGLLGELPVRQEDNAYEYPITIDSGLIQPKCFPRK